MFIAVIITLILGIFYLGLRDVLKYPRFSWFAQRLHFKLAMQHVALGRWKEAEKHITPFLAKSKTRKEALLLYIKILRETNRISEALHVVDEASKQFPEELNFRLEEAKIQLQCKRFAEALSAFRVCAPIIHQEADFLGYAEACFYAGYSDQCWQMIEPCLSRTASCPLLFLAGNCLMLKKKFPEAIDLYQKALEFGQDDHHVLMGLALAYKKHGNLSMAEGLYRQILARDSGDVEATLGLGSCLQERGFYQKALWIYQSGLAWDKNDSRLLFEAAYCALFSKKYDFAIQYFSLLIGKEGPSPRLLILYAHALEKLHRWMEAEHQYLTFVSLYASDPRGYRALAWLYGVGLSTRLSSDEGVKYAQKALELLPDMLSWEILSACEARRGNFEEAHLIQESLSKLDSDSAARARRYQLMRMLRKQLPLDDQHVIHTLVA